MAQGQRDPDQDYEERNNIQLNESGTKDPLVSAPAGTAAQDYILGKSVIEKQTTQTTMDKSDITTKSPKPTQLKEAYKQFEAAEDSYGSYTAYYEKAKKHIAGLEVEGQQKLRQERVQGQMDLVSQGKLNENDFYMREYGYDILADAGHDVRSVGYWYNKIQNNDSSNPLTNQYTLKKVIATAKLMYNEESWADAINKFDPSKLSLLEEKSGTKLDATDMKRLFATGTDDDTDYENLIAAFTAMGSATRADGTGFDPIIYDNEGKAVAYYHTDGKIYKVVEEGTMSGHFGDDVWHATYKDGKLQGLQDNWGAITVARSTLAGALRAVTNIAQVGSLAVVGIYDLGTWFAGEEFGDDIGKFYADSERFMHKIGLLEAGYYDADGANTTVLEIGNTIGSIVGTMAGMMAFGAFTSKMGGAAKMAEQSAKSTIKGTASIWGMRASNLYTGSSMNIAEKISRGSKFGMRTLSMFEHGKLVTTYVAKDLLNNLGHLNMRYDHDQTFRTEIDSKGGRKELFNRSATAAAVGGAISLVLAGGRDDSPVRRWATWTGVSENDKLGQFIIKNGKSVVYTDMAMDFIENLTTMAVDSTIKSKDGELKWNGFVQGLTNPHSAAMSFLMAAQTAKGSARRGLDLTTDIMQGTAVKTKQQMEDYVKGLDHDSEAFKIGSQGIDAANQNRAKRLAGEKTGYIGLSDDQVASIGVEGQVDSRYEADAVWMLTIFENSSEVFQKQILNNIGEVSAEKRYDTFRTVNDMVKKNVEQYRAEHEKLEGNVATTGPVAWVKMQLGSYKLHTEKAYQDYLQKVGGPNWYRNAMDDAYMEDYKHIFGQTVKIQAFSDPVVRTQILSATDFVSDQAELDEVATNARNPKLGNVVKVKKDSSLPALKDPAANTKAIANYETTKEVVGETFKVLETFFPEDFEVLEHNGETYLLSSDTNPLVIAGNANVRYTLAEGLSGLASNLTNIKDPSSVINIVTALNNGKAGEITTQDAFDTIYTLQKNGHIEMETAAYLLKQWANLGGDRKNGRELSQLKYDNETNPLYRYYKNIELMDDFYNIPRRDLTNNKENQRALSDILLEVLNEGEENAGSKLFLADNPKYEADLYTMHKSLKDFPQSFLPQEIKDFENALAERISEEAKEQLSKDGFTETVDTSDFDPLKKNNTIAVAILGRDGIRLSQDNEFGENGVFITVGFKTATWLKIEKQLGHEIQITAEDASFDSNLRVEEKLRKKVAREILAVRKIDRQSGDTGVITFDRGSNPEKRLASAAGYRTVNDMYNPENLGITRYDGPQVGLIQKLTPAEVKEILEMKPTRVVEKTSRQDLSLQSNAEKNSLGLGFISEDDPLSFNSMVYLLFNQAKEIAPTGETKLSWKTVFSKVKAAVAAGDLRGGSKKHEGNHSPALAGELDEGVITAGRNKEFLDQLAETEDTIRIPKEQRSDYFMKITPGKGMGKDIVASSKIAYEYFKTTVWDLSFNKDDSWTLTLNKERLAAKITDFENGILTDTDADGNVTDGYDFFKFLPFFQYKHKVDADYINKPGFEMLNVNDNRNYLKTGVSALVTFRASFLNKHDFRDSLFEMLPELGGKKTLLRDSQKMYNTHKFKEVELPNNLTAKELELYVNSLDDSDSIYIPILKQYFKLIPLINSETLSRFGDNKTVAQLCTNKGMYTWIVETIRDQGKLTKDSKEKAAQVLLKKLQKYKPTAGKEGTTKLALGDTYDGTDFNGEVGMGTFLNSLNHRVTLDPEEITIENIRLAIDYITENAEKTAQAGTDYVTYDQGASVLKQFLVGDHLELSFEDLKFLSDSSRKYLESLADNERYIKMQDQADTNAGKPTEAELQFVYLYEKEILQKSDEPSKERPVEFTHPVTGEKIIDVELAREINSAILKKIQDYQYNRLGSIGVENEIENIRDSRADMRLTDKYLSYIKNATGPGTLMKPDFSHPEGRRTFATALGGMYDSLKAQMYDDADIKLSQEQKDDLYETAWRITSNKFGTRFWNEAETTHIVSSDGKVKYSATSGNADFSLYKMLYDYSYGTDRGDFLVVTTDDPINPLNPQVKVIKMDQEFVDRALKDARLFAINKTDSTKTGHFDEAAVDDYYSQIRTGPQKKQLLRDNFAKAGMPEEGIDYIMSEIRPDDKYYDPNSSEYKDTQEALGGEVTAGEPSERQTEVAKIINYGAHFNKEETNTYNEFIEDKTEYKGNYPGEINKSSKILYNSLLDNVNSDGTPESMKEIIDNFRKEIRVGDIKNAGKNKDQVKITKEIQDDIIAETLAKVLINANKADGAWQRFLTNEDDNPRGYSIKNTKKIETNKVHKLIDSETYVNNEAFQGASLAVIYHDDGSVEIVEGGLVESYNRKTTQAINLTDKAEVEIFSARKKLADAIIKYKEGKSSSINEIEKANRPVIDGEEVILLDNKMLKYAYANEGWRNALAKHLKQVEDLDYMMPKNLGIEDGDIVVGFNLKNFDLQKLLDAEMIDQKTFDRLKVESIDVMREAIEAGLVIDNQLNLEAVRKAMLDDDNYKKFIEPLGNAHDAATDAIVTAYAYKYLNEMAGKDITSGTRNKVFNDVQKISELAGVSQDKIYDGMENIKGKVLDNSDIPRNTYDNSDEVVRKNWREYAVKENADFFSAADRELTRRVKQNVSASQTLIEGIKGGGHETIPKFFNTVYSLLSANPSIENKFVATARIVADTINLTHGKSLYGSALMEALARSKNYNSNTFEVATAFVNKLLPEGSKITAEDFESTYHRTSRIEFKDEYELNPDYIESELNRDIGINTARYIKKTLNNGILKQMDLVDDSQALNIFSTFYIDTDQTVYEDGKRYTKKVSVADKYIERYFEEQRNIAAGVRDAGTYLMVSHTPSFKGDEAIPLGTVSISQKVYDANIDSDVFSDLGDKGLYMLVHIDPAVDAGGSVFPYKVIVDHNDTKDWTIKANETTIKNLQRDLDGDRFTISKIDTIEELEYIRGLGEIRGVPFTKLQEILDVANKYEPSNFNETKLSKQRETIRLLHDLEIQKQVEIDKNIINNLTDTPNRLAKYEEIIGSDFYNVKFGEDVINLSKYFFDMLDETGRVKTNTPMLDNVDQDATAAFIHKQQAEIEDLTLFAIVNGRYNKDILRQNITTKKPLENMPRTPIELDDIVTNALENAAYQIANKYEAEGSTVEQKADAMEELKALRLDKMTPKEILESIEADSGKVKEAVETYIEDFTKEHFADDEVNKKMISLMDAYDKSGAESESAKIVKALMEYEKIKDEYLGRGDYFRGFDDGSMEETLVDHIINTYMPNYTSMKATHETASFKTDILFTDEYSDAGLDNIYGEDGAATGPIVFDNLTVKKQIYFELSKKERQAINKKVNLEQGIKAKDLGLSTENLDQLDPETKIYPSNIIDVKGKIYLELVQNAKAIGEPELVPINFKLSQEEYLVIRNKLNWGAKADATKGVKVSDLGLKGKNFKQFGENDMIYPNQIHKKGDAYYIVAEKSSGQNVTKYVADNAFKVVAARASKKDNKQLTMLYEKYGYGAVMNSKMIIKRFGANRSKLETVQLDLGNGLKTFQVLKDVPVMAVEDNMGTKSGSSTKFSAKGKQQSTFETPEALIMYGNAMFKIDKKKGTVTIDTNTVSDAMENMLGYNDNKGISAVNGYPDLQMAGAFTIRTLFKTIFPEYNIGNIGLENKQDLLNYNEWGSYIGDAVLNKWKKQFATQYNIRYNTAKGHGNKTFDEIMSDLQTGNYSPGENDHRPKVKNFVLVDLFKPLNQIGGKYKTIISTDEPQSTSSVLSKTPSEVQYKPGIAAIESIQDKNAEYVEDTNQFITNSYRSSGFFPKHLLFKMFGGSVNEASIKELSQAGLLSTFKGVSTDLEDSFTQRRSHQGSDEYYLPKGMTKTNAKTGTIEYDELYKENQAFNSEMDFVPNQNGTTPEYIEHKEMFAGRRSLDDSDKEKAQTKPVSAMDGVMLENPRVVIGMLKNMLNMTDTTPDQLMKIFTDGVHTMDDVTVALGEMKLKENEDGSISASRLPTKLDGPIEEVREKLKSGTYSAYQHEQERQRRVLKDLSNTERAELENEMANGKTLDEAVVEQIQKTLDSIENPTVLPMNRIEHENLKVLINRNKPLKTTTNLLGEPLEETWHAMHKNAMQPSQTDWMEATGFKLFGQNKEVDNMIDMGFPQVMMSGDKKARNLFVYADTLNRLFQTKGANVEDFNKFTKAQALIFRLESRKEFSDAETKIYNKFWAGNAENLYKFVRDYSIDNREIAILHAKATEELISNITLINNSFDGPPDMISLFSPYIAKKEYKGKTKDDKYIDRIRESVNVKFIPEDFIIEHTADDYINSLRYMANGLKAAHTARAASQLLKASGAISNNEVLDLLYIDEARFRQLADKVTFEGSDNDSISELIVSLTQIDPDGDYGKFLKVEGIDYSKQDMIEIYSQIRNSVISDEVLGTMSTEDLRLAMATAKTDEDKAKIARVFHLKDTSSEIVIDLLKRSPEAVNQLFADLIQNGKDKFGAEGIITDSYGRHVDQNEQFYSLYQGSWEFLYKDLLFNKDDDLRFKLDVLAEALNGNIYYGSKSRAELLNKHLYLQNNSQTQRVLRKVKNAAAELIMINPFRLPARMLSYMGTDIAMGMMIDPMSVMNMGKATKMMRAYYQSNGRAITPEWESFLIQKGGWDSKRAPEMSFLTKEQLDETEHTGSAFDKIKGHTYDKIKDVSAQGFDLQSDSYRFVTYLTLLERFSDPSKENFYGQAYHLKEHIDNMKDQTQEQADLLGNKRPLTKAEQQAYRVMTYTFGGPGTFPVLAKKTGGLFMFDTFSLAFARNIRGLAAGGIKALDLAVREGDMKGIYTNIAPAAGGLIAISLAHQFITEMIGKVFGMEEEDVDEIKKKKRTLDPIGTLLFGAPVFNFETFSPMEIFKEMAYTPIMEAFNDDEHPSDFEGAGGNIIESLIKIINQNATTRLNPLLKMTTEILTQKDLYGSDVIDTKADYTFLENVFRKTMTLPLTGGVAKALVDAYGLQKYNGEPWCSTYLNAAVAGIKNELGNSKAYKSEKNNYYRTKQLLFVELKSQNEGKYDDYTVADLYNGSIKEKKSQYDKDDAKTLSKKLNKAARQKEPVTTIYNIILESLTFKGGNMSPDTVRSVVNNFSIVRKLNQIDNPEKFFAGLSDKQKRQMIDGIKFEKENFPGIINMKFDEDEKKPPYLKQHYTKKPYTRNGNSSAYLRPHYTNTYYKNNFAPGKYYKEVPVTKVSSQMGIWDNKY